MLPRRPFRGSGKVAHTARKPARRDDQEIKIEVTINLSGSMPYQPREKIDPAAGRRGDDDAHRPAVERDGYHHFCSVGQMA
jgi:hypothetical protein